MATTSNLILPGDPEFEETLGRSLPPDWQALAYEHPEYAIIAKAGQGGVLTAVPWSEAEEYLEGGEYEERLLESEDEDLLEEFYFEG
ncbi:hypothetical protein NDA01_03580 [Trichocoleus desertorum AS-A10]|uniref:hypothetical protein n=1 Tax=Trichocoleus desertorum TaxID=1481672 RepID=UPI003297A8CB